MIAQKLIGKTINEFAINNSHLPDYFGGKYYPYNEWNAKHVNGQFIAKKYKSILDLVKETKAKVEITDQVIIISYSNGVAKIDRDVLTDTFLIPSLKNVA